MVILWLQNLFYKNVSTEFESIYLLCWAMYINYNTNKEKWLVHNEKFLCRNVQVALFILSTVLPGTLVWKIVTCHINVCSAFCTDFKETSYEICLFWKGFLAFDPWQSLFKNVIGVTELVKHLYTGWVSWLLLQCMCSQEFNIWQLLFFVSL